MEQAIIVGYQIIYAVSLLVLISLGLAVIFGMMRVINLAQGEFMMLGAYCCNIAIQNGINLWMSFLVAAIVVGLFGILVERILIRFLYGRIVDTLLATWGLSIFLVGGTTLVMGPTTQSVPAPFGTLYVGAYGFPTYGLVLMSIAFGLLVGTYLLLRYTTAGLVARGTMQNPTMAAALGVPPNLVYMLTFGFGSALTGLAGAVIAPLSGVAPTMGTFFIAKAFITVIAGGQMVLLGTISASALFGSISGVVDYLASSVVGEVCILLVAIVLLRVLPLGITGRFRWGI
jgi:branched-subunit amino acid ABC-type transport system permease component